MKKIIAYLMALTLCVSIMPISCITAASGEESTTGEAVNAEEEPSESTDDKNETENKEDSNTEEQKPDESDWHMSLNKAADAVLTDQGDYYQMYIINPGGAENGGADKWDVQFKIRGISIEEGHKYRLTYNISSDADGYYYTKIGNTTATTVGAAVAGEAWHNQSGKSTVKSYSQGYILWDKSVDYSSGWNMQKITYGDTLEVTSVFDGIAGIPDAEWTFFLGGKGEATPSGCFEKDTTILFTNLSLTDLTTGDTLVSYNHHDGKESVRGDIDGNGITDLSDLLCLSLYLLKDRELDDNQIKAADLLGDGQAGIDDLAELKSIIMLKDNQ